MRNVQLPDEYDNGLKAAKDLAEQLLTVDEGVKRLAIIQALRHVYVKGREFQQRIEQADPRHEEVDRRIGALSNRLLDVELRMSKAAHALLGRDTTNDY